MVLHHAYRLPSSQKLFAWPPCRFRAVKPPAEPKPKSGRRRRPGKTPKIEPDENHDDAADEDDEAEMPTPAPKKKAKKAK